MIPPRIPATERPILRARHPHLPFSTAIPRHWLRGSVLGTALANSLNLLFPWGERMFIRSVRAHADHVHDPLLDEAHPVMQDLLRWHAAEEIEHKCVAFDVLAAVDPRWSVRAAGLGIATIGLLGFWIAGTIHLLRQDPEASAGRILGELALM